MDVSLNDFAKVLGILAELEENERLKSNEKKHISSLGNMIGTTCKLILQMDSDSRKNENLGNIR